MDLAPAIVSRRRRGRREAELIVLSLCVGLFQAINFSLLFYKLHSGYTGRVRSLYMSSEEHKVPLDDKCPTLVYTPRLLRSGRHGHSDK